MTKSRGVLIVLIIAAALWALTISAWQAGAVGDTLGPSGVAEFTDDTNSGTSPVATACVAIIAVTGLLAAMLGKVGRFVVLGLAAVAALGYGVTALTAASAPGATSWPIVAAVAAGIGIIGIIWVATASAKWTNSNRYARTAEAADGEFDSAAAWDALSRGEDIPGESVRDTDAEADDGESATDDGEPDSK
jgi:MFS family permease